MMRKIWAVSVILSMSNLFAGEPPMLRETPFAQVLEKMNKGQALLLEVGSDSCHSYQIMGKLLYTVKQEHPNYPIYFVNVKKEREAAFKLKIQMIPTQIVLDEKGNEVYRHVDILSPEELNSVLQQYISIHELKTHKE